MSESEFPPLSWPEGLDAERFLQDRWQRRALFMPGALAGLPEMIGAAELAGLALEPEVESRLITGAGPDDWRLEHGPFEEQRFAALSGGPWTLLVQDADNLLPALAPLLQRFAFLPRWRIDDLMFSVASSGGSVGPHTDSYDVFLVQVAGRRRWTLGADGAGGEARSVGGLSLVEDFEPVATHECGPGDVLYVPPATAHHGVALDDACITCSVGFRAPELAELLATLAVVASEDGRLYADPDLDPDEAGTELSSRALQRVLQQLDDLLQDPRALAGALGRAVTRPKASLSPEPHPEPCDSATFTADLAAGGTLRLSAGVRYASWEDLAFLAGEVRRADPTLNAQLAAMADGYHAPGPERAVELYDLYQDGLLERAAEDGDADEQG